MFKILKRYYDKGIYTVENVKIFVKVGKITAKEFYEITSEEYKE